MKVMFTVQGEGRGHMTQAIAMNEMLQRRGYQVAAVIAGSNQTRSLPTFFEKAFPVPVQTIASPGFSLKGNRGVSMTASIAHIVAHLSEYRRSLEMIGEAVKRVRPDLIINFLEP